jgi:hypothetical protein
MSHHACLNLRPETMPVKKMMRSVDLVFQLVITLQQQLLNELVAVCGSSQRLVQ